MILHENEPTQIRGGRDPFARGNVIRARVYVSGEGCAWCGHTNAVRRVGLLGVRPYLYRFGWDSDGGRKSMDARLFCSRECREMFHG